jgi:hypothetical protein
VILYESDTVRVLYSEDDAPARGYVMPTYSVKVRGKRLRSFRGECAWSDAERYAYDHDRNALGCTA